MPIEQLAPEFGRIVSPGQELESLATSLSLAEGPLWHREGGYLLFSEINKNRRMKWASERA